jgi:hypothetical protein
MSGDSADKGRMNMTHYFITSAPGYYGDRSVVVSSHKTLRSAQAAAAAAKGLAIYAGDKRRGEEWLRVYEQHFPRMPATTSASAHGLVA